MTIPAEAQEHLDFYNSHDIIVRPVGGAVHLVVKSAPGREWIANNLDLEDWQWIWKDRLLLDHRAAYPIIDGMENDGLKLYRVRAWV